MAVSAPVLLRLFDSSDIPTHPFALDLLSLYRGATVSQRGQHDQRNQACPCDTCYFEIVPTLFPVSEHLLNISEKTIAFHTFPTITMRKELQQRLQSLKSEYEAGQKMMAELEAKQANLRDTLLRISGAIQVLEEALSEANESDLAENEAVPVEAVNAKADVV
jgi:hypothetical protein